jgi:hypothetical protein
MLSSRQKPKPEPKTAQLGLRQPLTQLLRQVVSWYAVGWAVFSTFQDRGGEAVERWTVLQYVYFATVTATTVGYGDLSPQTDAAKVASARGAPPPSTSRSLPRHCGSCPTATAHRILTTHTRAPAPRFTLTADWPLTTADWPLLARALRTPPPLPALHDWLRGGRHRHGGCSACSALARCAARAARAVCVLRAASRHRHGGVYHN